MKPTRKAGSDPKKSGAKIDRRSTTEATPNLVLMRAAPSKKEMGSQREVFAEHVSTWLREQAGTMRDELGEVERAAVILESQAEVSPELSEHFRRQYTDAWLQTQETRRLKTYDLKLQSGLRFFSPPYDDEWPPNYNTNVQAYYQSARFIGKCTLTSPGLGGQGVSAGLGFYFSSDSPVIASISPIGTYTLNWVLGSLQPEPSLHFQGGMATTIYDDRSPSPIFISKSYVWNQYGASPLQTGSIDGNLSELTTSGAGNWPVSFSPTVLSMDPGVRYLVWVWCWQITNISSNLLSSFSFTMPLVAVNVSPRPIVH